MSFKQECLVRARKLADWFVVGQVSNPSDANRGRYVEIYTLLVRGQPSAPQLSTNWITGMTCISMLMVWQRTHDKRYLESARMAGEYLKSLQILDCRSPAVLGFFRERTPQSDWCYPRDALSAAWGLLHLYFETSEEEYLWRARIFAEWFRRHAMKRDFPAWTAYIEKDRNPYWQLGSFHGGSPLFFFDLFRTTRERKWLKLGLTICDTWISTCLKSDGSLRIEVDPRTGKDLTGKGPNSGHIAWQDMHKLNDDFTALALLRAHLLTNKPKYLEAARRFLDWVLSVQNSDGSFGKVPVNSAAATLILELLDLSRITGEAEYRTAALRSVRHFFSLQELKRREPRSHGGFYCWGGPAFHNTRVALGARTSAYALAALLRLEGKRQYAGYTA